MSINGNNTNKWWYVNNTVHTLKDYIAVKNK